MQYYSLLYGLTDTSKPIINHLTPNNIMITVNTFSKLDYRALLAAGMPRNNKPISIKEMDMLTNITFGITKEVYDKLDLNNRFDVTIQTVS